MLIFNLAPQTPASQTIPIGEVLFDLTTSQNIQATVGNYTILSIYKYNEFYQRPYS